MRTKLVVYDLDGTLIDSADTVLSILNQMRNECGNPPIFKEDLLPWLSLGGENLIINALGLKNYTLNHNASTYLQDFRARYLNYFTNISSVYPSVHLTLECLISRGINLAICTNKPRILVEKSLNDTNLLNKFSFICAGDDLSTKKPHPNNLLACLNFFGYKAHDAILVGDSTVDQELCNLTDIKFVHFSPGYNDGVDDNKISFKISDHHQLLDLLV